VLDKAEYSVFESTLNSPIVSYLYSFVYSRCGLPNSRNHVKFRQNLTIQQFKVIQGHRSWCQWKAHMWLLI